MASIENLVLQATLPSSTLHRANPMCASVTNFAPYVAKIRASGADTVVTGNWGNDLFLLVRAGQDSGLDMRYYIFNGNVAGTTAGVGGAGLASPRPVSRSPNTSNPSSNAAGAIQVVVTNINSTVNGKGIILNPWADAGRPTPISAGSAIAAWDWGPDTTLNAGTDISKFLLGSCRQPTTASGFATGT